MTTTTLATLVLRVDATANAALAAGVFALQERLTDAAGLASTWPLGVPAVLLAVNGALCWSATRGAGPSPRELRHLAEIDVVFAVAVLGLALADPSGADTWLRVVLGGLTAGVAVVAATKQLLAHRLIADPAAPLPR